MPEIRSHLIVVLLNAKEGSDDEFNAWYTNLHMPAALTVPGIVSGRRFRLTAEQREGSKPQWRYLALYEVETDDLQGVIDELKRREGTPALVGTETIAPGGSVSFFEAVTGLMTGGTA